MIDEKQIPHEAVNAALFDWLNNSEVDGYCALRSAITAALNAWTGGHHYRGGWEPTIWIKTPHLLLPVKEDQQDDV